MFGCKRTLKIQRPAYPKSTANRYVPNYLEEHFVGNDAQYLGSRQGPFSQILMSPELPENSFQRAEDEQITGSESKE